MTPNHSGHPNHEGNSAVAAHSEASNLMQNKVDQANDSGSEQSSCAAPPPVTPDTDNLLSITHFTYSLYGIIGLSALSLIFNIGTCLSRHYPHDYRVPNDEYNAREKRDRARSTDRHVNITRSESNMETLEMTNSSSQHLFRSRSSRVSRHLPMSDVVPSSLPDQRHSVMSLSGIDQGLIPLPARMDSVAEQVPRSHLKEHGEECHEQCRPSTVPDRDLAIVHTGQGVDDQEGCTNPGYRGEQPPEGEEATVAADNIYCSVDDFKDRSCEVNEDDTLGFLSHLDLSNLRESFFDATLDLGGNGFKEDATPEPWGVCQDLLTSEGYPDCLYARPSKIRQSLSIPTDDSGFTSTNSLVETHSDTNHAKLETTEEPSQSVDV